MPETYGYSRKVMEIFSHPHNIGEIKDADAIGKVGNISCGDMMWMFLKIAKNKKGEEIIRDAKVKTFGCLPPEEKIVLSGGGWGDIGSVSVNEKVVNGLGRGAKVTKTYEINYDGPLLSIFPLVSPFNSFSVTPEHPVLAIKRKWFKTRSQKPNSKWPMILDPDFLLKGPKYVKAGELEHGDYLVFSFNKEIRDIKFLTRSWMRLIGYYLSEGYISANNGVVNFSFHKKEKKPINEVKTLVFEIIGKKCTQRTRGNVTEVYVCSRELVKKVSQMAGKYASKKQLSKDIMLLPPKKQLDIVETFYIGDGDKTTRRKGNSPTYRLATASVGLAIQLQEILARNGVFGSIVQRSRRKRHFIGEREIFGRDLYIVSYKKVRKHKFIHRKGDLFLVPIKRIRKKHYKGYVHNLHVYGEPNSYLVGGFVVHNCVAAISTSSVLTDLIKGKTMEEAMKVTKQDIVDVLKGLPVQKMHCSVLAIDALKEAVYDYYKRKGRPIPEELRHTHERVGRVNEMLEHRH